MSNITQRQCFGNSKVSQSLAGKRILVCGKGGSGKSSIVSLMANVLATSEYKVVVLDGDASNPGGLAKLMFGSHSVPSSLLDFFGGREKVECPVDNPAPLTRRDESTSIIEKNIDLAEIPPQFFIEKENIVLFQVGKTQRSEEGCDGPMSKVNRDFIIKGDHVTLIDVEAGVEHFGRGVEKHVDVVLVVVDPTFESLLIAEKAAKFCRQMGEKKNWAILNKIRSEEMESVMLKELKEKKVNILGTVHYYSDIEQSGLMGTPLCDYKDPRDTKTIIERLEKVV